jgi:uncharacterized protein (TIGR00730 family)
MTSREGEGPFPSAAEDAAHGEVGVGTPQTRSAAYRLAYTDPDFLMAPELRGVRLQLELTKADLTLQAHDIASTVVVFGSARRAEGVRAGFDLGRAAAEARRVAQIISRHGQAQAGREREFVIVTGGGGGIMAAANQGAADVGALSIGMNVVLPHEQEPNRYITPELCFRFHYFAVRKLHLLLRAKAAIFFPGGFGTLDELFETLTLLQTGKMAPIPVILFDAAFWRRIVDFDQLAAAGLVAPEDLRLMTFVDDAEAAWHTIRRHYGWTDVA